MVTISDICAFLGHDGGPETDVDGPAPLDEAGPGNISFAAPGARSETLRATQAGLLIVPRGAGETGATVVVTSENPRLDFIRVVERFFAPDRPAGVHHAALVAPSAELGERVYVGPGATIGEGVVLGSDTVIHAGVHLYEGVRVGARVTIHAGAVIGADGCGFERDEDGRLRRFPHLGTVVVEDDAEIGANACIDRGTLGETRIGRGAKLDNLVHVGHNAVIGPDAAVIALSMIGGSTHVGEGAWISPTASIQDKLSVGAGAVVGTAAVVTRDVGDGETVVGSPARPADKHRRLLEHWASVAEG